MPSIGVVVLSAVAAFAQSAGAQSAELPSADRLYGRVLTAEGERLEGYLRWDRNEASWVDFLDGEKEISWAWMREAEALDDEFRRRRERERSVTVQGVRISWDVDESEPPPTSSAAVRFGHVRSIEVEESRRARVTLVSGEVVVFAAASSDLGPSLRGLVVEDRVRGRVELRWRDLARVDFASAPEGAPAPPSERLYGTLRTRRGIELTGHVAWDLEETLASDVLDGDEGGRDREIPFSEIAALEPVDRRSVRVVLRGGGEVVLRGSNDVNEDNRGIEIAAPGFGRAVVPWAELERLTFGSPVGVPRSAFDGGRPLRGSVETADGRRLEGRIRWDNDEASTWEVIDGQSDGVAYAIELAHVRSVEPVGRTAARVELRDGRGVLLEGASDVDDTNRGLFVELEAGETVLARWRDVVRVTFEE